MKTLAILNSTTGHSDIQSHTLVFNLTEFLKLVFSNTQSHLHAHEQNHHKLHLRKVLQLFEHNILVFISPNTKENLEFPSLKEQLKRYPKLNHKNPVFPKANLLNWQEFCVLFDLIIDPGKIVIPPNKPIFFYEQLDFVATEHDPEKLLHIRLF